MSLTNEERLLRDIVIDYAQNTITEPVDFTRIPCDITQFIETVKYCKVSGIVHKFVNNNDKAKNVSHDLLAFLSASHDDNVKRFNQLSVTVKKIARFAWQNSVKVMFGGSYVLLNQIYACGDLYADELTVYTNKSINLSHFSKTAAIRTVLKEPDFFDEYYSNYLLINELPLYGLYEEAEKEVNSADILNDKLVNLYLLQMYFYNIHQSEKRCRNSRLLNNIFSFVDCAVKMSKPYCIPQQQP